jgi:membrane-bound metal-dependent hydrolase YbcI (DUF457 family)
MFAINHAATALVVKKTYPQAPLPLLLISVQLVELLWVALNYLGIEYSTTEATVSSLLDVHLSHMPYSHSIVSTIIIAGTAWFAIKRWLGSATIAKAAAIAIASHVVLDLLTHSQDIALVPFIGAEKLGLGLYAIPFAAFIAETLYGVFKLLLATIIAFNLGNFTFLSTAIIGPEALLAGRPQMLTTIVLVQIVVTLTMVGLFSRRNERTESTEAAELSTS